VEKIKIRGLYRGAGWIFCVWGTIVGIKGFLDMFRDSPSEFIPLEKWVIFSRFEFIYGIVSILVGMAAFEYAKRVAEYIERPRQPIPDEL